MKLPWPFGLFAAPGRQEEHMTEPSKVDPDIEKQAQRAADVLVVKLPGLTREAAKAAIAAEVQDCIERVLDPEVAASREKAEAEASTKQRGFKLPPPAGPTEAA
jgi:predicted component of type VI protein secretion system